tara:strand:+ start:1008 stop:1328 length:321 start_codon:yes stop_codon:yes gene_type:complete
MKLTDIILEANNWTKFEKEAAKLKSELVDTYNRDDFDVSMIQHSNGDKLMGKVTIKVTEDLPSGEYQNMKNFISAKGFTVTGGDNYADIEPGERRFYPNIKFEIEI